MASRRRFCSRKCEGLSRRKHVRERRDYSSAEWITLRDRIVERDGRACKRCGVTFGLIVHHIKPWRSGGEDTDDNLVTVCRMCHAALHAELDREFKLR